MRRVAYGLLLAAALATGMLAAVLTSTRSASPVGSAGSPAPGATGSPGSPVGGLTGTPNPSAGAASPSAEPSPTPVPTPVTAISPLTGLPVAPALAKRHPIAVMVDDHWDARPQSGFNQAAIVWHAPAEGGIPRYMMVFEDGSPTAVGPVRSSRLYFLQWAAEYRAVYAHAGGSPQAMAALKRYGSGQLVYNAEDFRWERIYFWRIPERASPHNLYTDYKHLRALGKRLGAKDTLRSPIWTFAPDAPLDARPTGGRIDVRYQANAITYRYDRKTNTYLRYTGGKLEVDAADKHRVAPKNVVVMVVRFGPLNDGHPQKGRLEAANIGSGRVWVSTNGVTVRGTWRKTGVKAPTQFYDAKGNPIALTAGQTFIQVVPKASDVKFTPGKRPAASPTPSLSPVASPSP